MYGIQKQQLKHLTAAEYKALRELCFLSKNMFNVALYNIRQHYFSTKKSLSYESNYHACKANENYQLLNKNSAEQTIKVVHCSLNSFFELLKKAKNGSYDKKVRLPQYLEKDGFFNLIFAEFNVSNDVFNVPMSTAFKRLYGKVSIPLPSNLKSKKIKEIRIIPKHDARFFEIQYVYEIESSKVKLSNKKALAIDLGLNNLATCVTNTGEAFIVDGKKLKSINAYTNKKNAKLQSIKDKQKIEKLTNKQTKLWQKREYQVNDYLNKSARLIIDYCIKNKIGNLVLGYNKDIQKDINLGKQTNQNFVNIPLSKFKHKLEYLCERYNITLTEQEESYTSQADFLMNDEVPVYSKDKAKTYTFSGKRIKRGLYRSGKGVLINADINGALNILKKSKIAKIKLKSNEYMSPKRLKVS